MVFLFIKKLLQNTGKYYVSSSLSETSKTPLGPANFEEAISATGYGKYNIILNIISFACCWSNFFSIASIPFVSLNINCNLKLSLMETGILNASPPAGMILSGLIWGYIIDTYGRKVVVVYGSLTDAAICILTAFSHSTWMLIILKFINGFICNGQFVALVTYLPECHSVKYRSRSIAFTGIFLGSVSVILPILGLIITPLPSIPVFNNYVIYSWQIYLLICAIPSLITGLAFIPMPESPKYLLANQRYDEALQAFQKIFHFNTGIPVRLYPITDLKKSAEIDKDIRNKKSTYQIFIEGFTQMKQIFIPPNLWILLIVTTIQFATILGSNTLRSWLPLLFKYMDNYNNKFEYNTSTTLCEMIEYGINIKSNKTESETDSCIVEDNTTIYSNLLIIGTSGMIIFIFLTYIVNKFDISYILIIVYVVTAANAIGLIWSNNITLILTLCSIYVAGGTMAGVIILTLVADSFPTDVSWLVWDFVGGWEKKGSMAISLTMMAGRIGAVVGNLIFPYLLVTGCYPPFILLSAVILVCIPAQVLFVFLTKNKPIDDEK